MYFSIDKVILNLSSDPKLLFKDPKPTGSHKQAKIEQDPIIPSNSAFAGDTQTGTYAEQTAKDLQ
jgi:hypothetical protein